jgi:hypothetical protein
MQIWTDGFEENLVMGIRNWYATTSDWKELRRVLLEARVHNMGLVA